MKGYHNPLIYYDGTTDNTSFQCNKNENIYNQNLFKMVVKLREDRFYTNLKNQK
jgi:hypothetical protein